MPSPAEIAANTWLTEGRPQGLRRTEFTRTGFQGGMNWYRVRTTGLIGREYEASRRTIDQPSTFISGKSDWGNFQTPGALEAWQRSPAPT